MLIVALQDDVDSLYAIWNTVSDRFLGVNLNKYEAVGIIMDYKENYTFEEALDRVEHPQPFSDIAECIVNGNSAGIYVECPHCGKVRRLNMEEKHRLLGTGKQVICDCDCNKLYTIEFDDYTIFTH